MRLLEQRLVAPGFWHLAETPEHEVAGDLRYSPTRGLSLRVLGTLHRGESPIIDRPESRSTIIGTVQARGFGSRVILAECLQVGGTISMPGFAVARYKPSFALFTSSDIREFDQFWDRAAVGLSNLWEWTRLGRSSLWSRAQHESTRAVTVETARQILTAVAPFGHVGINVFTIEGATWGRYRVTEEARLEYSLTASMSARMLLQRAVAPLQDFISLVTTQASAVTDVSLSGHSADIDGQLLYNRVFASPARRARRNAHDILLPFGALTTQTWEHLVTNWLAFHNSNRAFCGAFFGSDYARIPYVELRFIAASRSLRLLWRSINAEEGATANSRGSNLSQVVTALFGPHASLFVPLALDMGAFAARADWWEQEVDRVDGGRVLDGAQLHWYTEALRMALRLWILLRLEPTTGEFLAKTPQVQWLATKLRDQLPKG